MKLASKLGDTKTFRIPLRWENAAFLPDVNYNLTFTLKKDIEDPDDVSVIQKATGGLGIVIDGSNALLTIIRSDTFREADFPDPGDPAYETSAGSYYWDIKANGVGGFEGESKTVASGEYLFSRSITRMTGPSIPIYTYDPSVIDPNNVVQVASPANDDMIQRVGGSWVTRTIAQVRTALGLGSAAYTASTTYDAAGSAAAAQAFSIQRANHTGTQAHTTITGLGSAAYVNTSTGGNGAADSGKAVAFGATGSIESIVETGTAVYGESNEGIGVEAYSVDATGGKSVSVNGTYHHEFGGAGSGRSFVAVLLGAFGWWRRNAVDNADYNGRILAPANLEADRIWTLQDKDGTIAYTNDAAMTDERVPTAAGLTSKFGTAKGTIANGDKFAMLDSAASDAPKHTLWSLIVSTLTTAFNSLYVGLTGNQTIAGNKTLSGQTELTGQAATNSTSAMTRKLTEDAVTQSPQIQTFPAFIPTNSGAGSLASATAFGSGWWLLLAGTATSGYSLVFTASDLTRFSQIDGTGINFTVPFTVSGNFRLAASSPNHEGFHRILIGDGGSAPVTADTNAFSELGIGIELRVINSPSAHTRQVRMIYYSSGSYKQTSWVTIDALAADDYHKYYSYAIQNDGDGNARLYLTTTAATSGIPRIIGSSAIISVSDAPTGLQATRRDYIRIVTVNSSAAYTATQGYFGGSPITVRLGN